MPGMGDEIGRKDLARYLAGLSSPEEGARVLSWLDRHPTMRARLETSDVPVTSAWRRSSEHFLSSTVGGEADPTRSRFVDRSPRTPVRLPARSELFRGTRTKRGAVVLVVVLVAVLAGRELLRSGNPAKRFNTGAGEVLAIRLPDGSDVQLNVASRVEIPSEFGVDRRVVLLHGEAYFDVAFDPAHPFVVETATMEVEVRGTSFGVSAYDPDPLSTVVVSDGTVTVRTVLEDAVLTAGYRAEVRGAALHVDSVDVGQALSWREGRLSFRAEPLVDAARRMERWWGIEVVIRDSTMDSLRIDGAFDEESAAEAAHSVAAALGIGAEIDSRRITFYQPSE